MFRSVTPLILVLLFSIPLMGESSNSERFNTRGLDLEVLSYGGSLGAFYSIHPSKYRSYDFESDWALVESNDTFTYYDYLGRPMSLNNRNLSFVKFLAGATWFPFIDTMHPSLQFGTFAAAGPLVALNTDDHEDFVTRWKDVEVDATLMGRAGVQLRVLNTEGSAYTFRVGYDYGSFNKVIDERQTYRGLFFQAAWEFLHR